MKFRSIIYLLLLLQGYTAFITSQVRSFSHPDHVRKIQTRSTVIPPKKRNDFESRTTTATLMSKNVEKPHYVPPVLPCGDEIDKKIFQLAVPAVLNFAIVPLIGAVDTFWIGRMKNAYALAGQGAANQIFNSAFWLFSFLPSVITPLIAKAQGREDINSIRAKISEGIFISLIMGIVGTMIIGCFPHRILSLVLKGPTSEPVRVFAEPYLAIRAITFLPALLSTIGFAVFRGLQDVVTPLKISIISNIMNLFLDPLLIFRPGQFGVVGAAIATCLAEFIAFILYARILIQRKLIGRSSTGWFGGLVQVPSFQQLIPLLLGGFTMQLRSIAINAALIAVTQASQRLDHTGTAAAAHTISIQLFQLGSIASLAMSTVASVLVPMEASKAMKRQTDSGQAIYSSEDLSRIRSVTNRLLVWGLIVGIGLAILQLLSLPALSFFTPLREVQAAARAPAMIGALLQLLNCFVWTGEGIQQGNEDFTSLAISTIVGTIGMFVSLKCSSQSLAKVWMSFVVLAGVRLLGVLRYHFFTSPFRVKEEVDIKTRPLE